MGALRIFFEEARARQEDLVAAWIIRTEGSTYRKAGALMLFSRDQRAGLLSGGCLEGDLHEHARQLLNASTSSAALSIHRYDSRGSDDPIWGLGLGCEGLMEVLLLRCTANSDYQPLRNIFDAEIERRHLTCHIDLQSGEYTFSTSDINTDIGRSNTFSFRIEPRPHILICGAGPDVDAVVFFANKLAWQLTVVDHRPAYTEPQRFGDKARICAIESADSLARQFSLDDFSAALVMSHHLLADTDYLIALTESNIPYIGLLGPAARRERLLSALGTRASLLQGRLRAPVGLDIGAQSAEEIALAIVAEIHASLRGRDARPFTTAIAHPYTR
jgi:xanthine dehydrogenase accessory factor